jgi:hypothetical protein
MRSTFIAIASIWFASSAWAQSYPSPIFSGLNIASGTQSIANSPTGNPTVGPLLTTYSSLNLQGTTTKSGNREFLMSCGLNSTLGFGQSYGNEGKVCGYFGVDATGSSGDVWAINPLVWARAGVGAINVQGAEIDLNIDNQDYGVTPGQYSSPVAVALDLSGYTATGKTATAAIQVSSVSAGYWNRGVALNGDSITTTGCFICDHANSHSEAVFISGSPTYGIRQTQSGVRNAFAGTMEIGGHIKGTGSAPVVAGCGTSPSIRSGSTDIAGEVTTGTGGPTGCTITFASAYAAVPFCTVVAQDASLPAAYSLGTTGIVLAFTGAANSKKVNWTCFGT